MKRRIGAIVLSAAMMMAMLAGCSSSSDSTTTTTTSSTSSETASVEAVKVGVLLPMSGSTSYYGEVQLGGIELFVEYLNENGGIESLGGAPIELVIADSAGSPETGMSEFEGLIDAGVCAVIGPYNSTVAAATAPLAIQYGIPYIIVNATADNFMSDANKYVYRTNNGSFDFYDVIASMYDNIDAAKDGGIDNIAIVYDSGDWGTSVNTNWTTLAEEKGLEVSVAESVSNASDMTTLVTKIKAAEVDFVATGIFSSDANLLVRTLSEYDADILSFGSGGGYSDQEFISNLGDMAELCLLSTSFNPSYIEVNEIAAEYNERYIEDFGFDMPFEACWGWTGMATLADAINRAGSTDTEDIADALYVTDISDSDHPAMWFSIYDGIHFATEGQVIPSNGELRYNNNDALGDLVGFVILQVQNGEWVSVLPADRAQAELITEFSN